MRHLERFGLTGLCQMLARRAVWRAVRLSFPRSAAVQQAVSSGPARTADCVRTTPSCGLSLMPSSLLVLILTLSAAACSSDDPVSEPAVDGGDAADGDAAGDDAAGGDAAGDDAAVGEEDAAAGEEEDYSDEATTLAEFLGIPWLSFNPEDQHTTLTRQQQEVQELAAACMASEGFEYIPVAAPESDVFYFNPFDVEYAREHGFGITTIAFGRLTDAQDADDWVDPNYAIVDAMSESEQAAYREALYGAPRQVGFQTDPDTGETEEVGDLGLGGGCMGQAYEEVYGGAKMEALFEEFDLESVYERVETAPRMLAAYDEWSDCMRESGYEYDHPESMYETVSDDFQDRLQKLIGLDTPLNPFAVLAEEADETTLSDMSPEEAFDLYKQAEQEAMANVDQEALAALQEEERDLAVANAECADGMLDVFQEVAEEHESQFIKENRAALEKFRSESGN